MQTWRQKGLELDQDRIAGNPKKVTGAVNATIREIAGKL
jgi:hypothetical protein